ncbi:MAG: ABC transporter permease [Azoarcus sp.]|jgi:lipopolysaccharide transport system permease protein|nr:ABC transporter permease [Azoarcus sp.]
MNTACIPPAPPPPAQDISDSPWHEHDGSNDIITSLSAAHVWLALGWHDIRQRYRRSVLGPLWFTLSTFILVGTLGFLYSNFLNQEISLYLPFLGAGLVVWQYLNSCAGDAATTFTQAGSLIKQIRMPITIHILRMVWRNFVIMLHSLPVLLIMMLFLGHVPTPEMLLVPLGLLLLAANCVWIGVVLGILCTRYRDIQPIVGNLFQVVFFFTPVMWTVDLLKERAWVAEFNPLYHLIQVVRAPLIGAPLEIQSWTCALGMSVMGFALAQYLMKRCRNRISYWI